jgi:threonine aldolase
LRTIDAPDGTLHGGQVRRRLRKRELHEPATSLICLENAHSSGKVVQLSAMDEVRKAADDWNLPIHLDGARIFNAAAALHVDAAEIAKRADSVMFCVSKGLCAPVGSLLAGPKDFVAEARMKRKIMGGGLRQAGILAAAGIIALKQQTKRLAEDHARARALEAALAKIPGISVTPGDIDMVWFNYAPASDPRLASAIVDAFLRRKIKICAPDAEGNFRFVTHYWIGDKELQTIIDTARETFKA